MKNIIKKWDRSLGKSKRELEIITSKMPKYSKGNVADSYFRLHVFLLKSYRALTPKAKEIFAFQMLSKEKKDEYRKKSYSPYL